MKIEHLGTEQADRIRQQQLRGTTDSGSTKHLVFHIDNQRGYSLLKSPGSSFSNNGSSYNYVAGDVSLIWHSDTRILSGFRVWSTARKDDGVLTPKRADELVEKINAEIDSLCSPEYFAQACAEDVGKPVTWSMTLIGSIYQFNGNRCLESKLQDGPKCVKIINKDGFKSNWLMESTSEEHEERKKEQAEQSKKLRRLEFARQWISQFDGADDDRKVAMVLQLSGGRSIADA